MDTRSNNILEGEIIRSFSWYLNLQTLLGTCRINIRRGIVTPPTILQKMYTVFIATIVLIFNIEIIKVYLVKYENGDPSMYRCVVGAALLHFTVYLCNLVHVRFFNNEANVMFCMILQQIDRCLNVEQHKDLHTLLGLLNRMTVAGLCVFASIFCMTALFYGSADINLNAALTITFCEAVFILELSHCSSLMASFALRMRFLNSIITNHLQLDNAGIRKSSLFIFNKVYSRHLAFMSRHDLKEINIDEYLNKLLSGFSEFHQLYTFQIFLFCSKAVIGIGIYFQILIIGIRSNALTILDITSIVSFTGILLFLTIFMCLRVEIFLRDFKEMKNLCITLLRCNVEGPLREKARRTQKILENNSPRLSVYGMWDMDATIILKLFNVATFIIVTQLQFAYL